MKNSIYTKLNKLHILLVEDDNLLREEIANALKLYCNNVISAKDGQEGLDLFNKYKPDVILTDINLPKMSGLKMVEQIREIDHTCPIIIFTAYDTLDNLAKSFDLDVVTFLKKPFNIDQLFSSVLLSSKNILEDDYLLDLGEHISYDTKTKTLYKDDAVIELTKIEKNLFDIFMKNQNSVISFTTIEKFVWYDKGATPDTIRMYVNKLRKKLYYDLIENIQGVGYKMKKIK